jgi:hypothetical protein
MTHDIALSFFQNAKFPHRCVVCESPNPDTIAELKIVIANPPQSLAEDVVDVILDTSRIGSNGRITLKPEVCHQCKKGLKRYHFWKQIWQYLGPLSGVAIMGICLFKNLTILGFIALAAGIILPVAYELKYPPAISATGIGKNINYEFLSQLYSQEFAELNQTNIPINPTDK